jgi:phosphatidylglycerophosphatase A
MYKIIATCLGIGYIPKGGGTVASVFCALCLYFTRTSGFNLHILPAALVSFLLFSLGAVSAQKVETVWGKDNYKVVMDEVAGMWISMLFIPVTISSVITGLILFRVFDISKPLYINRMENLPGGMGVMMDDILAGAYTNIILQVLLIIELL